MFRRALSSRSLRWSVLAAAAAASSGVAVAETSTHANEDHLRGLPSTELVRSLLVYKACQYPFIVDNSPKILGALTSVPGVKQLTELVVRHTFFLQFVGGDTAAECVPVVRKLRRDNIGCLFAYSVEVAHEESESHGLCVTTARRLDAQNHVDETVRAIEVAGAENLKYCVEQGKIEGEEQIGSTWVAVKLTGLMADPAVLFRLSNTIFALRDLKPALKSETYYPGTPSTSELDLLSSTASLASLPQIPGGLTSQDLVELAKLREDMMLVMRKARQHGVRIIMDSEHSWFEPAVNAVTMLLSQEFNRPKASIRSSSRSSPATIEAANDDNYPDVQPLIYGTYQAYLRRNLSHLSASLTHAREHSYTLGVKLVRGAYHSQEISRWDRPGPAPVFDTKVGTDASYDASAAWLLDRLEEDIASSQGGPPKVGVLFGTHNSASVKKIVDGLEERGLAKESRNRLEVSEELRKRLCFGQLYGMADTLTYHISTAFSASGSPLVLKYLPYGAIAEVLPYLGRRAIENKTVLSGEGGAVMETGRAWREIRRRVGV